MIYTDRHHEIKINLYAIILGLVASFTGYIFRNGVEMFDEIFYGNNYSVYQIIVNGSLPTILKFLILILIPAIGGVIVGFGVWKVSMEAKGHGIPNVMEAMYVQEGRIRGRVPIAKFILSILTIGSGNSAGSEGPIAQIGAGLGSYIGQKLKLNNGEINILIATGAASAIAAVFNAPLGGALFGIEILLASITLRSVIPVIIGTATAITSNSIILNNYKAVFSVPTYIVSHPVEYVFFIILGVIIALIGVLWQKSLSITEEFFDNWNFPFYLKTGLGGLGVGIILYFSDYGLRGSSYPMIEKALLGFNFVGKTKNELLVMISIIMVLAFLKIAVTSLTLGSGNSGGVFSPSLLMGSLTGVSFGIILYILFPNMGINPGLYAVLGLAALFGAVARAPLTMIIITTEMSGEYGLFPALMITVSTSYLIHNMILKETIYTEPLVKYGLSIRIRTTDEILNFLRIREVMNHSIVCIYEDTPISVLPEIFTTYHHQGYPVVDRESHYLRGIISFRDYQKVILRDAMNLKISDVMTKNVITVRPNDPLKIGVDKIYKNSIGRLPVVISDPTTKELIPVGIFSRSDIIKALESMQKENEISHNKKINETKEKITEPMIEIMPSKYPHLKNQVVTIQYDWIGAYLNISRQNSENRNNE